MNGILKEESTPFLLAVGSERKRSDTIYKVNEKMTVQELLDYGFTNYNKPYLYFARMIGKGISFNVSIKKKDFSKFEIDVLDESFLQPFDFENIKTPFALEVKEKYNELMAQLEKDGILQKK